MRRPHALLAVSVVASVASAALIASLVVACGGGNDKPPLTPDNLDENAEAGAAPATTGTAPAAPSGK